MIAFDASLSFTTFTIAFVVADLTGDLPIFMSLTARMTPNGRERVAWQATLTPLIVLATFAFFGQQVLRLLGISVVSMQVSGGLLLLIVAVQLLSGREEDPDKSGATDAALIPLRTPFLAGPGAIAAVMLATDQAARRGIGGVLAYVAAVLLVHVIEQPTMRFANPLDRILGEGGTIFLTKISDMLLAVIAVQFIISGITSVVKS